jgi:type I restriction enzyme S subunit
MITNLNPYPAYKPSGVPWLGEVPEHWEVNPVKRYYAIQLGKMLQTTPTSPEDVEVPYLKAQHVQWFSVRTLDAPKMWASPRDIQQFGITAGDLLVCEGGEGGRCGIVKEIADGFIIQNALHRVRPRDHCRNDYLQYVMRLISVTGWFEALNNKATIAHFTGEKFGSLYIPIPLHDEQTAIVRFLDYKDRRIRRFIRAKQKLIKLLEEYRQALIHQAVTGKIDVRTGQPYAAYKRSGVPWLGKVPEHWELAGLRYLTSCLDGRRVPLNAVARGNMQGPYPYWGANKIIDFINDYLFDEPLVLLGEDGAPFFEANKEVAFFVEDKIWVNNHAHVLRCKDRLQPRYLVHVLNLTDYTRFVDGSTRDKLTQQAMGSIPIILPRLDEQTAIVEYLDAQTSKLDTAIATTRREIELLREYRTRLIADVVIGKVDVREVAAQLPEEPPEEEVGTEEEEVAADELATVDSQEESNGEE